MLNINSKLQTLFARGGATGGALIPARQSVARLTTVLFVVITAMFILTGCGLGTLINAARTGNLPCNINPFQAKCYPTPQVADEKIKKILTEDEIAALTPEQIEEREKEIAAREAQAAKRKAELEQYAPQRQALIEPVVAECTVNPRAARCRDAFVWCSDFENTNSPECASALAAESGVFSCLKDPYNKACEQQAALQEEISGQVVVRDEETGDVMLDDNGEEVTTEKKVSLVENTRQARINYCRDTNDAGVPNIEANPVLCESTVTNVCNDPENPSGVFDVFCEGEVYEARRLDIVTGCNAETLTTVEEGCTSVVKFCNLNPFGNPNCNIPAFAPAREVRVNKCIIASTATAATECGVELANNPCFGDPFVDGVDGVDCADPLNMGSPENVKTAQQSRSVLCVNAFIASRYPDICGGASATECVMNPFGDCADDLGTAGQTTARQVRALYCVIGTKTEDPLCSGIQMEECFIDPSDDACDEFFGDTYTYTDENDEEQTIEQQDRAENQRGVYCATVFSTQGGTTNNTLCEAIVVNYCERAQGTNNPTPNLFIDSTNPRLPDCLSREDYDGKRLQFVDECRAGTRTTGCASGAILVCNNDPFGSYVNPAVTAEEATATNPVRDAIPLPDICTPAHFDGARADKIAECLVADATGCDATFEHPNAATWLDSFDTPLVALDTSTPKNQFLLGTADGIDTPSNVTATLLTIEDDAKNGVGFFSANSKFYAGLFNGANLGEPLNDVAQAGTWTGNLQAVVGTSATLGAVLPMTLNVVYTGNTRTINAFVLVSGETHFLLNGTFTEYGVIDGTVNYGPFTGKVESTPMDNRGTNGILTGIIGQDGALGAFHSNESETSGYAGGFIATK